MDKSLFLIERFQLRSLTVGNVLKKGATCYLVTLSVTHTQKSMVASLGTGLKTTYNELF